MTQYIFFSGKGGVGKTTMAATTAVYQAGQGKSVLLVSTDPAGNLGDIFEKDISTKPAEYAKNLFIAQMDSESITEAYKQKMLEPLSEILDELALKQVEEEFNSGCTVEIATFDKFTDFLSDQSYDLIVFDTAPTGHTLRLMTLPGEWSNFILKSAQGSGQTCIGPVSQIENSQAKYEHAVATLQDPGQTTVYLVSKPEKTSVYETLRAKSEFERTGIFNFQLIINGVYPNHGSDAGVFSNLEQNQQNYISDLKENFKNISLEVPMQKTEIKGFENISRLGKIIFEQSTDLIDTGFTEIGAFNGFSNNQKLDELIEKQGDSRIVVLTGKGGVGKTVAACATAWKLAQNGKTLLLTTDPASHIGQVMETSVNYEPANIDGQLWAANIEQKQAVENYREKIINDARDNNYSDELLASLEEELESPCTEEIAIFEQFANLLNQPEWDYIVLDTAPTGHTLRLMELPFEYKEQLDVKRRKQGTSITPGTGNQKIETLINRMKNPGETSFILVAYPEYTPLQEGYRAMKDLQRVGIETQGVFINHVLNIKECPEGFAKERWKLQQHYLLKATEIFKGKPLFPIPLQKNEINGLEKVKQLSKVIFS